MAKENQLAALRQGSAAWDEWRSTHQEIVDLSGCEVILGPSSKPWNFSRCRLSDSKLKFTSPGPHQIDCRGADLRNFGGARDAELDGLMMDADSQLEGAQFSEMTLVGIDFSQVALKNVSFFRSSLRSVTFQGELTDVEFGRAKLMDATFTDCVLVGCSLSSVEVDGSAFDGAEFRAGSGAAGGMENARFTSCSFLDAKLSKCKVAGTQFIDCDLRRIRELELDDTVLRGTVMSPWANDDWSVLRRKYTGANMAFNLIALVVFFLPWIFQTVYWIGVNQTQSGALTAAAATEAAFSRMPPDPQRVAILEVLHKLAPPEFERCIRPPPGSGRSTDVACRPIWQVLLGVHEGWTGVVLGIFLLVYNTARLVLTWLVAPLRDEESRSWHAPRRGALAGDTAVGMRGQYGWMMYLHQFVTLTLWVAVIAAFFHLGPRLLAPVWLGV